MARGPIVEKVYVVSFNGKESFVKATNETKAIQQVVSGIEFVRLANAAEVLGAITSGSLDVRHPAESVSA